MYAETSVNYENEKQALLDTLNQKKELCEAQISLEKQISDLAENLNAQVNINTQLKAQYSNLLKMNSSLEKQSDDLREKNNNLLIQKDLLDNEIANLRSLLENEKSMSAALTHRAEELEVCVQSLHVEAGKRRDRENFNLNEASKLRTALVQLEKEKSTLEFQLKNIEHNISGGGPVVEVANGDDVVSEILHKFNEERRARQLSEEKTLGLEKHMEMLNADICFVKEDLAKKERDFNEELGRYLSLKKETDAELSRRGQEIVELSAETSNLKIKEKHLTKISQELREENTGLKEECERLRKVTIETENSKVRKLQEELEELKTMNQLYRSQRLESNEEIGNFHRETDKLKSELSMARKEM